MTRPALAFVGHRAVLIRRTLGATLIAAAGVAAAAAAVGEAAWGIWFGVSALWSLGFLGLTPLILRLLLFEQRPFAGMLLVGVKFIWLGLMVVALAGGTSEGLGRTAQLAAMIAGLTTPLIVVTLVAVTNPRRRAKRMEKDG